MRREILGFRRSNPGDEMKMRHPVSASQPMRWFTTLALAVGLLCVLAMASNLVRQQVVAAEPASKVSNWPQFLGPSRNGQSAETALLQEWPAAGPRELWRVTGGIGMSGLAIDGSQLVTLVQRGGKQWALALDSRTGKQLWQTEVADAYQNQMGDGPRATPALSRSSVLVFTGEGILAALDRQNGKLRWSVDTLTMLKGEPAEYGMACSPLIVGDQVIVTVGCPDATVAAFSTDSGTLAWTAGRGPAGYSSPALLHVGGRKQVVVFAGTAAMGLMPGSGKMLWRYPYATDFDCNIAAPTAIDGKLFLSAGENHGCVLLELTEQGNRLVPAEVWASQGPRSVLRNEWQTSLFLGGYLYGMDNVGGAGPITHLTCVEAATGKRAWQVPRFGKGNLIAADGKLFMTTIKGELVIARATPQAYQELGRKQVLGSTRQAPALAAGRLYLRDAREIVCLDVSRK